MKRVKNKSSVGIVRGLELAGKPLFGMFTFILTAVLMTVVKGTNSVHKFYHTITSVRFTILKKKSKKKRKKRQYKVTKKGKKSKSKPSRNFHLSKWVYGIVLVVLIGGSGAYAGYRYITHDLPNPELLKTSTPSLSTKIYDRNGILLYQVYRDENRTLIKLDDLPPHLVQATIASEDKSFYSHHGIDIRGIARALMANSRGFYQCYITKGSCGTTLQGGSTITQQLIKNALLSHEKTLARKLREAYLAFRTESMYSKEQILELYFNHVPYGGTAYGIEEASHHFFGKSAREVTLPEAALLAGLPVAPTTLSPFGTHPYLAKNRQSQVLDAMVDMGSITREEADIAKLTPITFRPKKMDIKAPHFVMYIKDELVKLYGEDMVSRGGLEVTTTLDINKQQILESEITSELARLKSMRVGNAAGMITSPQTGEILAMVGSHDFFDTKNDGQVNVALQPRQPGSSIKPLTYTLALMNGLTPNSRIEDSPICFVIPGSPNYCPDNYDGRFHGSVTLRTALASSYNIPAIKLLNSLGVSKLVSLGKEMGITTWNDPSRFGLSLTLGGGEVKMLDMVQVYGIFANGGKKIPLKSIVSVRDHEGRDITYISSTDTNSLTAQAKDNQPADAQVIPFGVAYQISDILSDPRARAPAFGTRSVLNIPGYQVAVKTGTTNNLRDNWTFGYTPDVLVATWVGNNDNTPMSSVASGITGASPIWSKTIAALLKGTEAREFPKPSQMVAAKMCPDTGSVYCSSECSSSPKVEYFVSGTEPKSTCNSTTGNISVPGITATKPSPSPSPEFRTRGRGGKPKKPDSQ